MATVRIEYFDGLEWRDRANGEADTTADALADSLLAYAIQYPHRAYLDGKMIAEAQRPHGRRGKAKLVRFA